jgi:membrane protein implicated in regulation of membrane protease activity
LLTGTPLDLTPLGGLLGGLGILYWLAMLACVGLAVWWFKRWWLRLGVAAALAAAFVMPVTRHVSERETQQAAFKARLDTAKAQFEMRCKSAGEKIVRTVENVEGVVWMKWRDKYHDGDPYDQFKLNDPYGRDCNAEGCIEQLLRLDAAAGRFEREVNLTKGRFGFVESNDPTDGKLYRYTGMMTLPSPPWTPEAIALQERTDGRPISDDSYRFALDRKPISKRSARYGITWDDISTRKDREHWIAGGSLKVIDLQTNEVIAERVGYMMDRGLGSRDGFRTPWLMAERTACPPFLTSEAGNPMKWSRSRGFVFKVLQTTKER